MRTVYTHRRVPLSSIYPPPFSPTWAVETAPQCLELLRTEDAPAPQGLSWIAHTVPQAHVRQGFTGARQGIPPIMGR
jgi:hypothetical protein